MTKMTISDNPQTTTEVFDMRELTNTECIVGKDVLEKANKLAELISNSQEVHIFRQAEEKVSAHVEVQNLIKMIKKKQKELVAFETTFKNEKMAAKISAEIDELTAQVDDFPIVTEFKQTQEDLNYLLQLVFTVIRDGVSQKIAMDSDMTVSSSNCSD